MLTRKLRLKPIRPRILESDAVTGRGDSAAKRHPLPETDPVESVDIIADLAPQVVIPVAGPAKRVCASVQLDHRDFAAPVAFFLAALTGERPSVGHRTLCQRRQVKRFFLHQAAGHPFFNLEGDAESSHESGFRRDDDRFSHEGRHG